MLLNTFNRCLVSKICAQHCAAAPDPWEEGSLPWRAYNLVFALLTKELRQSLLCLPTSISESLLIPYPELEVACPSWPPPLLCLSLIHLLSCGASQCPHAPPLYCPYIMRSPRSQSVSLEARVYKVLNVCSSVEFDLWTLPWQLRSINTY